MRGLRKIHVLAAVSALAMVSGFLPASPAHAVDLPVPPPPPAAVPDNLLAVTPEVASTPTAELTAKLNGANGDNILNPLTVTVPPYSQSWYPTAYDLAHAADSGSWLYKAGYNAPTHVDDKVILEIGAWCTSGTQTVDTYGGSCTSESTVAYDLEYYMYGYYMNSSHRSGASDLVVEAATNNFIAASNTTNATAQGGNWQQAIDLNMQHYADQINSYLSSIGSNLRINSAVGNDFETQWGGPTPAMYWMNGMDSANSSAGLSFVDDGAYYGTCKYASCWNSALDHGWSVAQKYRTNWGDDYAVLAAPEIYDTGWPTYYADLDAAARAVGSTAKYGVPIYSMVLWSCGVSGASVTNVSNAYTDFYNATGQATKNLTYLHSEGKTC